MSALTVLAVIAWSLYAALVLYARIVHYETEVPWYGAVGPTVFLILEMLA